MQQLIVHLLSELGLGDQSARLIALRGSGGRSCKTLRILVDWLARKPRISSTIELCASGFSASGKLRNRYHYDAVNEGITVGRGLSLACFAGLDVFAISFGYAGEDLSYPVSLAFRREVPPQMEFSTPIAEMTDLVHKVVGRVFAKSLR